MREMTAEEMIEFLRDLNMKKAYLAEEKLRIEKSVESLDEAIRRNTFSKKGDDLGIMNGGYNTDKVLKILLDSLKDIDEETRSSAVSLYNILVQEDEIEALEECLSRLGTREMKLLKEVYIQGSSAELISDEMGLSFGYAYRIMRKAVKKLVGLYNSKCEGFIPKKARKLAADLYPYYPEVGIA